MDRRRAGKLQGSTERRIKENGNMGDFTIEVQPFSLNENMSELALEDFDDIRGKLSYCQCQSIGMALAKLKMIEENSINLKAIDLNDLISRKEVLEILFRYGELNSDVWEPYADIKNLPAAYDVDAVCMELGKFTKSECTLHECGIRSEHCSACMARKAIEIVRNGGKK